MSEQVAFLPDIKYHLEEILEEIAKSEVTALDLAITTTVGDKRYTLWLKVKLE
jgi:hypothetical protein